MKFKTLTLSLKVIMNLSMKLYFYFFSVYKNIMDTKLKCPVAGSIGVLFFSNYLLALDVQKTTTLFNVFILNICSAFQVKLLLKCFTVSNLLSVIVSSG